MSLAAALLLVSCGNGKSGDSGELFPRVVTLGEGDVYASVLNSSLTVGQNRMLLEIDDKDEAPILGADVHLRFFDLNGAEPAASAEMDARFVPVQLSYVDEMSPGKPNETTGDSGAYIASVSFDKAGDWGVRIAVATKDKRYDEFPFRFNVRDRSDEPMIGEQAPASEQATTATVRDITEIDSSSPPRPTMHDMTIADALALGKPAVIAFATPAYCSSRTCAPVMDTVMDPLFERYHDRATFIHVEPYVLADLRSGNVRNPVPAAREWKLDSEPWIFVVGADGRVAAKFQGIVSADEVEAALRAVLPP